PATPPAYGAQAAVVPVRLVGLGGGDRRGDRHGGRGVLRRLLDRGSSDDQQPGQPRAAREPQPGRRVLRLARLRQVAAGAVMTPFQLTAVVFGVLTTAVVGLQLHGRRRADWPVLGDVFSLLASRSTGRFLVLLGWWWLGWHFFVR